jgi:TonB-linked SusC/RagA family outer membrane protein
MRVIINKLKFGRMLLASVWLVSGTVMAQEGLASSTMGFEQTSYQNAAAQQTLGAVLRDIEKIHDVRFICRSELLDLKINTGNQEFTDKSFAAKLGKILKAYKLSLKQISSQQFAISNLNEGKANEGKASESKDPATPSGESAFLPVNNVADALLQKLPASAEEIKKQAPLILVSGTVMTRAANTPLQGVTVMLKGGGSSTLTNEDGKYAINVPDEKAVLVFSYVGYLTIELPVKRQQKIDVLMDENIKPLDQVIVVGYGTQKKVNLTGAVSAITANDLKSRPVTATSSALQGLLPGVTIRSFTGMPGQNGSTIRIRGTGTLGDSNPLIVIDGIPGGSMDILNPDDIESISVLKDAASSSIYGVRGANGVILVTTKKGRATAKPNIAYNNYFGFQTATALPEFLGTVEYMTLLNESLKNVGRPAVYTDSMINIARTGSDLNYYANTNWLEEIYKKRAGQQNHNLSINGGGNNLSYYLSYGSLRQDGLVTGDNFGSNRNNIRLRLNTKLIDRLDLDANIGYVDRKYRESSDDVGEAGGPIYASHQISPLVPVRFTTGGWGYLGGSRNPVAVATDGGYNDFSSQEFTGNLSATLNLFKGFKLRSQYALIKANSQREIYNKTINYFSPITGDRIYQSNFPSKIDKRDYVNTYQTIIGMAEYERTFKKHELKTLVGVSQESNVGESFLATRTNLVSPDVPNLNLGTANLLNSSSADQTALQSAFGRVNYVLNSKYLAELNFRYDGSSRFSKDVRWNLFPSASVGWRLSQEKFFSKLTDLFQEVKIRASYGELGNDKVGSNYAYLATIAPVGGVPPIGNVLIPGYAQTSIPNPLLTWETVVKQNIGLDLLMLNNRLGITADYFKHNTKNILLRVTLPDVLGATEPSQNAGKVENKGWELQVSWKDKIGQIRYGVNFNISDVKNQVTSLGNVPPTFGDQVRFLGEPIDAFYGLVADRISQLSDFDFNPVTNVYTPKFPFISGDKVGPGDIIFKDLNKDNLITLADDRQVIGNPFPRYTYGFRGDMGWKGFDVSFFIQGVGKAQGYIKGAARHAYINESANPQKIHLDRWTPDNPNASYPRFTYQLTHNQRFSTYWLEDASYMRLKNIQVGYTLPERLTEKFRVNRLRVFFSADNLFTKTNFFYAYDPESPVSSGGYYPQVKTFIFGINVNMK